MKLLTNEQIKSLKEYKYHGGDLSLLYKYVLSPFAEFCVKYFTPVTIAPNAITLLGLISSFLSTILTFIYNPLLDTSCPRWLCIFTGFSILFYQTLDNMDGKQARRTNSSSPLGLLFDHGCDAINTGLLSVSMSSVFGTGWNIKLFLSFYIGFVTFYIQTWEEYYTGAMILPILNGPSDGLFLISIFSFFTSFVGSQFWQNPIIELPLQLNQVCNSNCRRFFNITTNSDSNNYYISPFQLVVVVGVFWATVIIVSQVSAVLGMIKKSKRNDLVNAALDLLPITSFFLSILIWCNISSIALTNYPFLTTTYICAVFTEIVVHVMLMHVTNSKTNPLNRYLAYLTILLPIGSFIDKSNNSHIELVLIVSLSIVSIFVTSLLIYKICKEVSEALGIFILILGKRNQHDKLK